MKYGIKATYKDKSVQYASSTRGCPQFTDNADDIALFVQEASAVKVLKQMWKDGVERYRECTLEVVGVEMQEVAQIHVERPKQKTGIVLTAPQADYNGDVRPVYFAGPKKVGSDNVKWTDIIESATIFPTEEQARLRLKDSLEDAKETLEYRVHDVNRYVGWHESPGEKLRRIQREQDAVLRAQAYIDWHATVKLEEVTI
jgi:hypothetical protein